MAVQAVKRALFYYRSGVKEEPTPRDTLSHFSHSNWSDREETIIDDYGEPTTKLIPITSSIKSLVDQLSSEQWRKVIEEATQFTLKETDPLPSAAVSEYNENPKLVDDDEDLQPQPSSIDYDNPKSQSTTSSSGLTYDNSQSQPTAGSSHSANDDFQSQPSPGELGAAARDDLYDFDYDDVNMVEQSAEDHDGSDESVTESDAEMPAVARSTIRWVSYVGDSSDNE
ncbi:hypothetical protein BDN71DRAFT_567884 [Pleurotus eryngii]|uniref:Uncharacterized protein n=1 Tax=Pleurotus eryngii TaxID=5323 RepID=A0A9P6D1X3_PLEER|nr:hypothetical protein BDN71DRAFT_567884 [Pleurotus eryngii]